jgi:hypothetical protein
MVRQKNERGEANFVSLPLCQTIEFHDGSITIFLPTIFLSLFHFATYRVRR